MRNTSKRELGRAKRITIIASAIVLVGAIGTALVLAPSWGAEPGRFAVARIDVAGNTVLTADEIVELAGVSIGGQLLAVDPQGVERLLSSAPRVARERVSRRLPDRIEILLEETLPAAIVAGGPGGFVEVSDQALVLPAADRSAFVDVPLISGIPAPPVAGERFESELLAEALDVLRQAKEISPSLWMEISEVRFAPGSGLVIYTVADGAEIRFGLGAVNPIDLSHSWEVLLDLRSRGAVAKSIDLRFDGQVVVLLVHGISETRTQEGGSA
ncbi:FtsQ-type POTRA domain-containing protein [bacterium]|nr:FtsQ-type POTRA domain-containing protein [bacterium]